MCVCVRARACACACLCVCLCEVSSFQGVGVPLYTEVSSFQEVRIVIQSCPHFRVLE